MAMGSLVSNRLNNNMNHWVAVKLKKTKLLPIYLTYDKENTNTVIKLLKMN